MKGFHQLSAKSSLFPIYSIILKQYIMNFLSWSADFFATNASLGNPFIDLVVRFLSYLYHCNTIHAGVIQNQSTRRTFMLLEHLLSHEFKMVAPLYSLS